MKSRSLVYASSLFSLCDDENKTDIVMKQLREVNTVFLDNEEYVSLLDSPSVSLNERLALVDDAFSGADEYVINFIKILCENKSVYLFFECVKHYEKLYYKKNNIEKVTVITATPLSDRLKEMLVKKLEATCAKTILPEYKIDKSIIGGIVLRTENSQTDASLRSRLNSIKAQLSLSSND